jgi:hypothetical protein
MKRKDRIYKAIELVSDRKLRKSFVMELHEYLKVYMPQLETGDCPWACGYDLFDSPFHKLHKHFTTSANCKIWIGYSLIQYSERSMENCIATATIYTTSR